MKFAIVMFWSLITPRVITLTSSGQVFKWNPINFLSYGNDMVLLHCVCLIGCKLALCGACLWLDKVWKNLISFRFKWGQIAAVLHSHLLHKDMWLWGGKKLVSSHAEGKARINKSEPGSVQTAVNCKCSKQRIFLIFLLSAAAFALISTSLFTFQLNVNPLTENELGGDIRTTSVEEQSHHPLCPHGYRERDRYIHI